MKREYFRFVGRWRHESCALVLFPAAVCSFCVQLSPSLNFNHWSNFGLTFHFTCVFPSFSSEERQLSVGFAGDADVLSLSLDSGDFEPHSCQSIWRTSTLRPMRWMKRRSSVEQTLTPALRFTETWLGERIWDAVIHLWDSNSSKQNV